MGESQDRRMGQGVWKVTEWPQLWRMVIILHMAMTGADLLLCLCRQESYLPVCENVDSAASF